MVNAWNVGDLQKMILPPCHYGFQVYTRPTTRNEKIVNPEMVNHVFPEINYDDIDSTYANFSTGEYEEILQIIQSNKILNYKNGTT